MDKAFFLFFNRSIPTASFSAPGSIQPHRNFVECKESWIFLVCTGDSFSTQMQNRLKKEAACKQRTGQGCSSQWQCWLQWLCDACDGGVVLARKTSIKINTFKLRKADFCLFRGHKNRILCQWQSQSAKSPRRVCWCSKTTSSKHEKKPTSKYSGSQANKTGDEFALAENSWLSSKTKEAKGANFLCHLLFW